MTIAHVALPVAAHRTFDYWVPAGLEVIRGRGRARASRAPAAGRGRRRHRTHDGRRAGPAAARRRGGCRACRRCPPTCSSWRDFVARYYQEPLGLVLAQMLPPIGAGASAERSGAALSSALRITESGRGARRLARPRVAGAPVVRAMDRRARRRAAGGRSDRCAVCTARRTVRGWRDEAWSPRRAPRQCRWRILSR